MTKHWLHKKYDLEGWLLSRFNFKNEKEYLIFLVWALFVAILFSNYV